MKRIVSEKIILWIAIAILLFGMGIMVQWHLGSGVKNTVINDLTQKLSEQKKIDSVNIVHLNQAISNLQIQNDTLQQNIKKNQDLIKRIKSASINKQYEVYSYDAHKTKDYFMDDTGGGMAEVYQENGDTMISVPIDNVRQANIKFVKLDYVILELEENGKINSGLTLQVSNLNKIVELKDSVISIKDNQLLLSDTVINEIKKEFSKKEKKIKNQKIKTWVAVTAGATAIILLTVLK